MPRVGRRTSLGDVSTLRTSDNAVRHDLGLPPLSSVGGTSAGTSNSTPAATNSPTPAGTSNPTSPGGNASHSSSRGTNTIGGSGNPSKVGAETELHHASV